MPILPTEPDMFPSCLLDDEYALPAILNPPKIKEERRHWFCMHTKPRQEKALARHLHNKEVPYFLPQALQENRTPKGRKFRSVVPMFTSYVFCHANEMERIESLKGNHIANILTVSDQLQLVHDLRQIQLLVATGLPVQPDIHHPVGTKIRISNGPLAGFKGIIDRRGPRDRFVAVVEFLGRGVSVELLDWQVEPIY